MEISEEEAQELLNNPKNLANNVRFVKLRKGSRNGGKEVPGLIRELIGIAAHRDSAKIVAKEFDVSESTVAAAKKGNIGVNRHDSELRERIDNQVEHDSKSVRDVALDRISSMYANTITADALNGVRDPAKAVAVAKDLAAIADRVSLKGPTNQTAVFIHTVRDKEESEYGPVVEIEHIPDAKRTD